MNRTAYVAALLAAIVHVGARHVAAGQVPGAASDPDIPISHRDRVYAAEQFSNTVSVTDPVDNKLLGVIRLISGSSISSIASSTVTSRTSHSCFQAS